MIFGVLLTAHIAAGTTGLMIGPIAMFTDKRRGLHTKIGIVYFYLMALVCVSAFAMAILHWKNSWWFALVATFSFSLAWKGYRAVKNRGEGWLKHHISGMLGSYIAMTTAVLVVNAARIPGYQSVPALTFWLLPTLIGSPLVSMTVRKYVSKSGQSFDSKSGLIE